jgi:hypothetical protein
MLHKLKELLMLRGDFQIFKSLKMLWLNDLCGKVASKKSGFQKAVEISAKSLKNNVEKMSTFRLATMLMKTRIVTLILPRCS